MNSLTQNFKLVLPVALLSIAACGGEPETTSTTSNLNSDSGNASVELTLVHTAGANRINQIVVGALVQAEKERRLADGDDPVNYEISNEEMDAHIASLTENMLKKDPNADFWEQVAATGHTPESYRKEAANVMLIDRLLFPSDPSLWREDQLAEIFLKDEPNSMYESMVVGTKKEFEKNWAEGKRYKVDETMLQMILRPYFMRWLWEKAEIKYPFDGLAAGVALQINGRDYSTEEIRDMMGLLVGPVELDRAKSFNAITVAAEKKLAEMGVLISKEEALARIDEEKVEYENSPISYEMVALQFLGYPSMEAYNQVYRLKQSFKDSLLDEEGNLNQEAMMANAEARKNFLSDGQADCEVILLSARSMDTGRYAMEGDPFAEAAERANQAAKELADGLSWEEALMKYSELPESVPGAPAGAPKPNRGRFGAQRYNPLKEFLGENEYTEFLYGVSVADQIFFDCEPGKIYGPVSGCTGSYIFKLNRMTPPIKVLDPENDARHKYLVESDYLNTEFMKFLAGLEL